MKRFISFALALMMLVCFVGCDKEEVNYSFKSGEVGFSVNHDADAVIEKLGDPIDLVETPSCGGGEEPDREYTYSGFKFNTVNENGVNKIVKIVLTDDSVSTPEGITIGDGPIDAAFMAIEQIVGHHYDLDDFQIQSVTQGHEAMGTALVRLRNGGKIYSGNGISTDIIGASIRAYLNALNKIVYEEATE